MTIEAEKYPTLHMAWLFRESLIQKLGSEPPNDSENYVMSK